MAEGKPITALTEETHPAELSDLVTVDPAGGVGANKKTKLGNITGKYLVTSSSLAVDLSTYGADLTLVASPSGGDITITLSGYLVKGKRLLIVNDSIDGSKVTIAGTLVAELKQGYGTSCESLLATSWRQNIPVTYLNGNVGYHGAIVPAPVDLSTLHNYEFNALSSAAYSVSGESIFIGQNCYLNQNQNINFMDSGTPSTMSVSDNGVLSEYVFPSGLPDDTAAADYEKDRTKIASTSINNPIAFGSLFDETLGEVDEVNQHQWSVTSTQLNSTLDTYGLDQFNHGFSAATPEDNVYSVVHTGDASTTNRKGMAVNQKTGTVISGGSGTALGDPSYALIFKLGESAPTKVQVHDGVDDDSVQAITWDSTRDRWYFLVSQTNGNGGTLYYSDDQGLTWVASSETFGTDEPNGMQALPNGTIVISAAPNISNGVLYRSSDGGVNWIRGAEYAGMASTATTQIGFNAASRVYLGTRWVEDGGIWESSNYGMSFVRTGFVANLDLGDGVFAIAVDPKNPSIIYALGQEVSQNYIRIKKSIDGGTNWTTGTFKDGNTTNNILGTGENIIIDPNGHIYVVVTLSGTETRIYRATDDSGIYERYASFGSTTRSSVQYQADQRIFTSFGNSTLQVVDVEIDTASIDGTPIKSRQKLGVLEVLIADSAVTKGANVDLEAPSLRLGSRFVGLPTLPDTPNNTPAGSFFLNSLDNDRLCFKNRYGKLSAVEDAPELLNAEAYGLSVTANGETNRIAIQTALDIVPLSAYGGVSIPSGVYEIDNFVTMDSNTKLVGANGATLKADNLTMNLFVTNKNTLSGGVYTGDENITIENIIFDANRTTTAQDITIIGIAHATNIKVIDCDFTKWSEWHAVELNACKDSYVIGCRFYDAIKSDLNEEAVQLDLATSFTAFPWASGAPYDNTPCDNITIENCTFDNISTGIGTHNYVVGTVTNHVKVLNCTFKNLEYRCVSAYNWGNLLVSGCTCDGAERFVNLFNQGLSVAASVSGIAVTGNAIKNLKYGLIVDHGGGITVNGAIDGVVFSNNIIDNLDGGGGGRGLWVQGDALYHMRNVVVNGNTINGSTQHGLTIDYGEDVVMSGNTVNGCAQSGIVMYRTLRGQISGNNAHGNNTSAGSNYDIRYYSRDASGDSGADGFITGNNCGTLNLQDVDDTSASGNNIQGALTIAGGTNQSNANYIAGTWTI